MSRAINASATNLPSGTACLRTTDFDELAGRLIGWEADFRQLSAGPFEGTLRYRSVGAVTVFSVEMNRAVQARGRLRRPSFAFTPVTASNHAARWRGRHLSSGQLNMLDPASEMDHLTSAGNYGIRTLVIGQDDFCRIVSERLGDDVTPLIRNRHAIEPDPAMVGRLATAQERFLTSTDAGVAAAEAERLIDLLTESVVSLTPQLQLRRSASCRDAVAGRADDYIQANLDRVVTLSELSRELDVSQRTLEYAFRCRFCLSPKAYMRSQRLNRAKRLLSQSGGARTVTEIAQALGFGHPGEFARSYRLQFGQFPSETLRLRRKGHSATRPA